MAISQNSINEYYVFDYVDDKTGTSLKIKLHKDPKLGFLISILGEKDIIISTLPYSFFSEIVDFYNNKFNLKVEDNEEKETVRKIPIKKIFQDIEDEELDIDEEPSEPEDNEDKPEEFVPSAKKVPVKVNKTGSIKNKIAQKYASAPDPEQEKLTKMVQSDGDMDEDDDSDMDIIDNVSSGVLIEENEPPAKKIKPAAKKQGFQVKRKD